MIKFYFHLPVIYLVKLALLLINLLVSLATLLALLLMIEFFMMSPINFVKAFVTLDNIKIIFNVYHANYHVFNALKLPLNALNAKKIHLLCFYLIIILIVLKNVTPDSMVTPFILSIDVDNAK
jgi:hypothetical protein